MKKISKSDQKKTNGGKAVIKGSSKSTKTVMGSSSKSVGSLSAVHTGTLSKKIDNKVGTLKKSIKKWFFVNNWGGNS